MKIAITIIFIWLSLLTYYYFTYRKIEYFRYESNAPKLFEDKIIRLDYK